MRGIQRSFNLGGWKTRLSAQLFSLCKNFILRVPTVSFSHDMISDAR